MDEQIKILYREILERFNKIIWTHKIHLCQANIYLSKKKKQNQILLVFSVLVSASAITNIFKWLPEIVIVPLMAFLALTLTYFTTKYKAENLEKKAADSERFAAVMHDLRNKYAGFLSDIKAELYTKEQISKKRTELEHIENIVYSGLVPQTSKEAVDAASFALKNKQESTTTNEEILQMISEICASAKHFLFSTGLIAREEPMTSRPTNST